MAGLDKRNGDDASAAAASSSSSSQRPPLRPPPAPHSSEPVVDTVWKVAEWFSRSEFDHHVGLSHLKKGRDVSTMGRPPPSTSFDLLAPFLFCSETALLLVYPLRLPKEATLATPSRSRSLVADPYPSWPSKIPPKKKGVRVWRRRRPPRLPRRLRPFPFLRGLRPGRQGPPPLAVGRPQRPRRRRAPPARRGSRGRRPRRGGPDGAALGGSARQRRGRGGAAARRRRASRPPTSEGTGPCTWLRSTGRRRLLARLVLGAAAAAEEGQARARERGGREEKEKGEKKGDKAPAGLFLPC